jgi:galactose-1-phosphate uridylyltransferase
LTAEEFAELGELQALAVRLLHKKLDCAKEYSICFAEKEHFQHIHFHIVARPRDLPADLRGAEIFAAINVSEAQALPREEIATFCEEVRSKYAWN